jgi:hypothetical protein
MTAKWKEMMAASLSLNPSRTKFGISLDAARNGRRIIRTYVRLDMHIQLRCILTYSSSTTVHACL